MGHAIIIRLRQCLTIDSRLYCTLPTFTSEALPSLDLSATGQEEQ